MIQAFDESTSEPPRPGITQRLRSKLRVRTRLRSMRPRQHRRILALVPFRNEMRYLPGLFENLQNKVDGVIALDDQSEDGSREFVESQPLLLELGVNTPGSQEENADTKLHVALHAMAMHHEADWLLGIDADERLENGFRARVEVAINQAERDSQPCLWVPFKELWNSPDLVRVDGVWGAKRKTCLFKADPSHSFDNRRLHAHWGPWPPANGEYPIADLRLYHLKMIEPEDRKARRDLYNRLDPERAFQEIGYDYLVDETGIELQPIEPGRDFAPKR